MKKNLFILLVLIFMQLGCNKNNDDSEEEVHNEISNEMKMILNGVEWQPCEHSILGPYHHATGSYHVSFAGNQVLIEGINACQSSSNILINVTLVINNFNGIGDYIFGGTTNNIAVVDGPQIKPNGSLLHFQTDTNHIGFFKVTEWNSYSLKISGQFEFETFNIDSNIISTAKNGAITNVILTKI